MTILDHWSHGIQETMTTAIPPSLKKGKKIIADYVKVLPETPGVYRMVGEKDVVLYIGKAKNLKKRVESYTHISRLPLRHQRMVSETKSMVFVTTETEVEALILEANLIKTLRPRYNILLKDDKFFSYIALSHHAFPRLMKHRGKRTPDKDYYGPYASSEQIDQSLIILQKIFGLRSCTDGYFNARNRPCLLYHIKRCTAPCVKHIDTTAYGTQVQHAKAFLGGQSGALQKTLAQDMTEASQQQQYEKAAVIRDQIRALSSLQAKQTVHTTLFTDADIFALYEEEGLWCIQIFLFRNGSHHGSLSLFPDHAQSLSVSELLDHFLLLFYEGKDIPPEIYLSHDFTQRPLIAQALKHQANHPVSITIPKRGPKMAFMNHALSNARDALQRHLSHRQSHHQNLRDLAGLLGIKTPLRRIEIYDNSHIQATNAIGAMVVANSEGFDKKAYRKFTIKDPTVFGDDYGMMQEVMGRRFSGSLTKDETQNPLPDLVIIDGGKGQISVVEKVFEDLGVDIPLLGIAKGPHRNAGNETFYMPHKDPMTFDDHPKIRHFLQRLRDEAHRFAIGFHRQKREKKALSSTLDDIPGVGPSRRRALLKHFGSLKAIKSASVRDLSLVHGISKELAQKIHDFFLGS